MFTPRNYQLEMAKFLISRPNAGLLVDMGMGKTAVALAVIETLKKAKKGHKTFLIAPIRTLYTVWPEEIAKWGFNLTYHNLHESRFLPQDVAAFPEMDIYGINPESSLSYISQWRERVGGDMGFKILIVDESSLYKNPQSRRFKLLRDILHYFGRRWILTGTPAPNGLIDFWSQMYIVDMGASLGKYITQFKRAFCETTDYMGWDWIIRPDSVAEIYQRVAPYCLRFDSKDHLDMPELVHNRIPVKLPPSVMTQYKDMEKEFLLVLEETTVMSPNAAVVGMKCRQIANGGIYDNDGKAHYLHPVKTDALIEIIEELQGNPCLVFYEFRHDADRIATALGNPPPLTIASIADFNKGKIPVLMGHVSSLAYGLNLQESCHNVIFYGVGFDLAAHDQAIARVWRQGQKSGRVFVHYIIAEETIDETVLKVLQGKSHTQKALLDAMKNRVKETA